jgi:hypothetical protein
MNKEVSSKQSNFWLEEDEDDTTLKKKDIKQSDECIEMGRVVNRL